MKSGCCVTQDGSKYWYVDDKLHRLDGPAIEYADGSRHWCVDDKLHRIDGPAIEYADGSKRWYVYGKRHRLDGPAVEYADGSKHWYVNGKRIDEKEIMDRHQLNPDWTQWTDAEKTLFRLAV
jgi:hypothetical protein